MINKGNIERYIRELFGDRVLSVKIEKIGEGVQGAGFLIEVETNEGVTPYVIKGLFPEGLEHDYAADRAQVFLLDLQDFKELPKHVQAIDVLAEMEDGSIKSIGGGKEYYLLMEKADGKDYFNDLAAFGDKESLDEADKEKIRSMTSYLAKIHSLKKDSKALHWRKVRDTIGHGECLMGVFDTYPDGTVSYEEMAVIEKKCVDWRARLKPKYGRLCQVHGDFHPGNIWFKDSGQQSAVSRGEVTSPLKDPVDFILLDRSRGAWGDPADDVTALTMNYIFCSINKFGRLAGPYQEALEMFYEEYVKLTGDTGLYEVVAPFYAFRGSVVANPVFYPDVTQENRLKILSFVNGVLDDEVFGVERVNEYINKTA